MVTYELQRRLAAHGTTIAVAAHSEVSNTELNRNTPVALRVPVGWLTPPLAQEPRMGALPAVRAATDLSELSGQYCGSGGSHAATSDR